MRRNVLLLITLIAGAATAGDFMLFPERGGHISAETLPYAQMLHTGTERDTFYMRGRFGVDFPIAGYDFSETALPRSALFGITAATHINMIPASGGRFPVDNFYATLALHFSGKYGEALSWRIYPVYHVSAHLADGNPNEIIDNGVRPVSSEMVKGEAYYKLFGGQLELGADAGWYYHVCAQKNLKYRGGMSLLFTPNVYLWDNMIKPFALLRAENVRQDEHHPGIDISTGAFVLKDNDSDGDGDSGIGLSLRYFNKLHSGYYFEKYEKGWGAEYTFVF